MRLNYFTKILLLTCLYFIFGKLGLSLAALHENVSLVWPATGVALAMLLLFGINLWPGIFLGAFLVNATTHVNLPVALAIAVGNVLESFVAVGLLTRVLKMRTHFERFLDILGFIGFAAILATSISASIGVVSLCVGGYAPWQGFGQLWWDWWMGDMLGALVVAPLILVFIPLENHCLDFRKLVEAFILIVTLIILGIVIFWEGVPIHIESHSQVYLIFPLLIWAAIRFELIGAAVTTFIVSTLAIWGTVAHLGPFATTDLNDSLILLQLFMSIIASTMLFLAIATRERRQAQEELKIANEKLLQLNDVKSKFTSMVSHELRTPLSSIKEAIEIVMDGIDGPVNGTQWQTLNVAKSNVERLARLINSILDYARLEAGKMKMAFQLTNLNQLIDEVYHFMKTPINKNDLLLTTSLPQSAVMLFCDPDQIRQVLINLVHNAIKFTDKGGQIALRLSATEEQVQIEIEDTGIGIKKEDQVKIFDMFSQASYRGMWKTGGSGVGLAVCKLIVDQHKGYINVVSELGKGSRFIVTLPKNP